MAIIDRFTKDGASKFVGTLDDEEATYLLDALLRERGYASMYGYTDGWTLELTDKKNALEQANEVGDHWRAVKVHYVPVQGEGQ